MAFQYVADVHGGSALARLFLKLRRAFSFIDLNFREVWLGSKFDFFFANGCAHALAVAYYLLVSLLNQSVIDALSHGNMLQPRTFSRQRSAMILPHQLWNEVCLERH